MQYVSLIQMYASFIVSILLFFSHGLITYKDFSLYLAFVSSFFILYYFFFHIEKKTRLIIVFVASIIYALLYYYTSSYYAELSHWYNSYLLVLLGQSIPAILTAVIVSEKNKIQEDIKKLTPYLAIFLTYVAFDATFNPREASQGLSGDEEANLNYQKISYMAAYAAAFAGYFLLNLKEIKWHLIFHYKVWKYIMAFLIILNFVVILISGGRGGLVVFTVQFFLFMFLLKRIYHNNFLSTRSIILLIVVGIGFFYALQFAKTTQLDSSGFSRFLNLSQEESIVERGVIMEKAIDAFYASPVVGHGIGAVLNEIGIYSHNIFMDFLVNSGVLGCSLLIALIFWVLYKGFCIIRLDSSNCIWLIIFFDGFILSQFSSYFLSSIPMLWSAAFILSYSIDKKIYDF